MLSATAPARDSGRLRAPLGMKQLAPVTYSRLFLLVSLLAASLAPGALFAADESFEPVSPSVRDEVVARTAETASRYAFTLALDGDRRTISGSQQVEFVNGTGETLIALPFRLYPNADYYGDGDLQIDRVQVDGLAVSPVYTESRTIMTLPLPSPLAAGETLHIDLSFTTTVPVDSTGTSGVFSFDQERGTWMLADWYPILAGWEPGHGWVLDPPSRYGDPTFSETAFYELWVTIPNGWTIAATGTETPVPPLADTTSWRLVSGPVREFSLVIDDNFETASRVAGETTVTVYTDGSGRANAGGEIALAEAIVALANFTGLLGPYPYRELDLVETEMSGALAIAWTGLIFLNGANLLSNSFFVEEYPERLRFTVAHEVGHQWLGALVGLNSNDHSFLLEGWTNYLSVVVVERSDGLEAGRQQLLVQAVEPYLRTLESQGDGIADVPISSEAPNPSRGVLIYGKTALGALAIRREIGDDAFFTALLAWSDEFRFGIASPESLLAAFEEISGVQLDELWSFWFLEANTRVEDVHALLDEV